MDCESVLREKTPCAGDLLVLRTYFTRPKPDGTRAYCVCERHARVNPFLWFRAERVPSPAGMNLPGKKEEKNEN